MIGDQAQQADDRDGEENHIHLEATHGLEAQVTQATGSGDQFSHHQVSPGPAHGHPQGVEHARQGRRGNHMQHRVTTVRAKGVGGVDQVLGDAFGHVRDHHQLLEEHAENDHRHPLLQTDADPQDEQRHERGHRQVANEIHQRLKERLDDAETAHQQPQRHRHQGRHDETDHHHFDAGPYMLAEGAVATQAHGGLDHRARRRQEHARHHAAVGQPGPQADQQHPGQAARAPDHRDRQTGLGRDAAAQP
ncbi:hypothetical protein D3C86_1205570 [compost metagenome]